MYIRNVPRFILALTLRHCQKIFPDVLDPTGHVCHFLPNNFSVTVTSRVNNGAIQVQHSKNLFETHVVFLKEFLEKVDF